MPPNHLVILSFIGSNSFLGRKDRKRLQSLTAEQLSRGGLGRELGVSYLLCPRCSSDATELELRPVEQLKKQNKNQPHFSLLCSMFWMEGCTTLGLLFQKERRKIIWSNFHVCLHHDSSSSSSHLLHYDSPSSAAKLSFLFLHFSKKMAKWQVDRQCILCQRAPGRTGSVWGVAEEYNKHKLLLRGQWYRVNFKLCQSQALLRHWKSTMNYIVSSTAIWTWRGYDLCDKKAQWELALVSYKTCLTSYSIHRHTAVAWAFKRFLSFTS